MVSGVLSAQSVPFLQLAQVTSFKGIQINATIYLEKAAPL